VKRLCADDSAATSVKVGYRQANYSAEPHQVTLVGLFAFLADKSATYAIVKKVLLEGISVSTVAFRFS
jgi:hypothetical protein